jgi:GDP-L-fucose synthase
MRKPQQAIWLERVVIWGSGTPRREFLHVSDLAEASLFVISQPKDVFNAHTDLTATHINVGLGRDVSIRELAFLIKRIVGFTGQVVFDTTKPDGTPRKLLDVSKLTAMGWVAKISLEEGLEATYRWFVENQNILRKF